MAAKAKKSTGQINVELAPDVLDRLKAFADERGQTLKYVVGRAIERHMASPPPILPDPPLPEATPDPAPAPKPKRARAPRKPKGAS